MGEIETRIRVVKDSEYGKFDRYYPEFRLGVLYPWKPIDTDYSGETYTYNLHSAKNIIDLFLKTNNLFKPREEFIEYPKPIPPGDE